MPGELAEWLAAANADWQPSWEGLAGATKAAVREGLRREQGDTCAYCGARLLRQARPGNPNSLKEIEHIEHLAPREAVPARALDWTNLVLSCGGETGEVPPGHKHCGHAKANWHDQTRFVTPVHEGCEEALIYLENGCVRPGLPPPGLHAEAPAETLRRLNLDCVRLRSRRRAAIDGALGPGLQDLDELQEADLIALRSGLLAPQADGTLPEFGRAVVAVLDRILGDVTAE